MIKIMKNGVKFNNKSNFKNYNNKIQNLNQFKINKKLKSNNKNKKYHKKTNIKLNN